MNRNCTNCWWHCHTDGRCYVDPRSAIDEDYALKIKMTGPCFDWRFDGLQDWEREDEDALVAMEVTNG